MEETVHSDKISRVMIRQTLIHTAGLVFKLKTTPVVLYLLMESIVTIVLLKCLNYLIKTLPIHTLIAKHVYLNIANAKK
jgi:uncharacterized membrane protein